MKRLSFLVGAVLTAAVTAAGRASTQDTALPRPAAPPPALSELTRRSAVIKPTAGELRWQRIPWLTDLSAAQQVARKEGRPLLLWVTGDDPLERC
jgi:hypothetical protein